MTIIYDVFARKEHPEPLIYVGSVEVATPDEAAKVSLKKYGPQSDWIEMVTVPQQAIITIFSEHEEIS